MLRFALPWLVLLLFGTAPTARAIDPFNRIINRHQVEHLNQKLGGQILDFTHNHGCDRRLFCPSLGEKRDVYLYLPPGYDGRTQFPAALWLHGIGMDERSFLDIAEVFDRAIRARELPPMVIASPDGSVNGHVSWFNGGSFYLNSKAGNFEDYVAHDVWNFVKRNFTVRPEREAHVLAGASMGGFASYNIGFKHRDEFGQLAGIFPPLDLRYIHCTGRFNVDYDPNCVGERDRIRRQEVIATFFGVIRVRARRLLDPLVGRRSPAANTVEFMAVESPREMLRRYDIRPGEFGMFFGYGTKDEFNIDAMCQHFHDDAVRRGLAPEVVVIPDGHHDLKTALAMFPPLSKWLTARLATYVPPGYDPTRLRCQAAPLCAVRRCPTLMGR